jgi:hypothetical protein
MAVKPAARSLLTLLCAALLVARIGGAHLHLCFDGSEPAAAFHVLDASGHHDDAPAAGAPHQDADVAVAGDALAKAGKSAFELPALLLGALLLLALSEIPLRRAPPVRTAAVPSAPQFLRPPLRGPPAFSSH